MNAKQNVFIVIHFNLPLVNYKWKLLTCNQKYLIDTTWNKRSSFPSHRQTALISPAMHKIPRVSLQNVPNHLSPSLFLRKQPYISIWDWTLQLMPSNKTFFFWKSECWWRLKSGPRGNPELRGQLRVKSNGPGKLEANNIKSYITPVLERPGMEGHCPCSQEAHIVQGWTVKTQEVIYMVPNIQGEWGCIPNAQRQRISNLLKHRRIT